MYICKDRYVYMYSPTTKREELAVSILNVPTQYGE